MAKRSLPLARVYGLLEPGPVLLLTTWHKGAANVMTLSWHTMMQFEPPLVGYGNSTGRQTDKFKDFCLTTAAAPKVAPPLIADCHANLECRVVDTRLVNRCGFFVLEVLQAWIDPARKDPRTLHHRGRGRFMVAGETIKLPSKMRQPRACCRSHWRRGARATGWRGRPRCG